ncbi:histone-lysine N-methyltransferase 2C-like [Dreissena polymorpha]|uniref:histone-lysine N-methyltransferase 2C-like n=1 Tax=Dreissena polymorpha TaxID=45954 RepID=UPI00226493E5|nr:histone-lysine N-methyltransferase 2C-like [Dreissena polymorpha]
MPERKASGSPESIVSSSSPENGFGEDEKPTFPMLRPIEPAQQDTDTRTSPLVPLLQPVPVKYPQMLIKQELSDDVTCSIQSEIRAPLNVQIPSHRGKQDLDSAISALARKERLGDIDPITGMSRSSREDAEVSVTLTLSAKAAEDIGGVLSAIADLLKIAAPPSYEVSRSPSPDQSKSNLKHKEEAFRIHTLPKGKQTFCKQCEVVFVNAGVRKKKSDIPMLTKAEMQYEEDEMMFCSVNCFNAFTITRQLTLKPGVPDSNMLESGLASSLTIPSVKDQPMLSPRDLTPSSSAIATSAVTPTPGFESMETTPIKSGPPTPQLGSPTLFRMKQDLGKRPYKRSSSFSAPVEKKWKNERYKRFDANLFPEVQESKKKDVDEIKLWAEFSVAIRHDLEAVPDQRFCEFCHDCGDGLSDGPARYGIRYDCGDGLSDGPASYGIRYDCGDGLSDGPARYGIRYDCGDGLSDGPARYGIRYDCGDGLSDGPARYGIRYDCGDGLSDGPARYGIRYDCGDGLSDGPARYGIRYDCGDGLSDGPARYGIRYDCGDGLSDGPARYGIRYDCGDGLSDGPARYGIRYDCGDGLSDGPARYGIRYDCGDGLSDGPARLLNMDIDKWAHLNCALWSEDVYETLNGALMRVDQAYKKGTKQKCVVCGKMGATVGCFKQRCAQIYHVPCAKLVGCIFFEDKTILCPPHTPKGIQLEQVLSSLIVNRRVYINRDEDAQVANMLLQEDGQHTLRLGSLVLHSLGQLLPHQMAGGKFNSRDHIYPVGYKTSRFYWSMQRLYKRSRYVCMIKEHEGQPQFVVTVKEDGQEEMVIQNSSCAGVWRSILEPLEKIRRDSKLVNVFPSFTTGEELYGLTDPNIVRLVESLPGTDLLRDYAFKFGRRQLIALPLTINPSGCARSEPKLRTHFRKPHTLQSSSTHCLPSHTTGLTGDLNSPYMKHFVHSKSQQYRRLKTEWKNLVYLGRSRIQGLGLYAAKDLEMHTMVIEYIGDLIRNEVANRREKTYESQNRGVYMFRIDDNTVCDATMAGGPARYINHSCDPNCVAEVVDIDKEGKIIIITNRRINKGEELSYDYQFDQEDEDSKIPCNCGAWNCRKWMN